MNAFGMGYFSLTWPPFIAQVYPYTPNLDVDGRQQMLLARNDGDVLGDGVE
jgi:hypothetical protein